MDTITLIVGMRPGVSWYAFIVSSMSSIMESFYSASKLMREKHNKLNNFMRCVGLLNLQIYYTLYAIARTHSFSPSLIPSFTF